jgi:hypothetical protein
MTTAPAQASCHTERGARYYGKYRGMVVENIDPLELGRIFVKVAAVPGVVASPAMPCVPYAGPQVGTVLIPPIGANVWVEFEQGDPSHPIWVGCFWTEGEFPVELTPTPEQKLLRTESVTLLINDIPGAGGLTLIIGPPAVEIPITLTANEEGVTLEMAEAVFSLTPEEISALLPPSTLTMNEEGFTVEATGSIQVTCPENSVEGNVSIVGVVEITGNTSIEGNVDITGAVEITGDTEVTGAVEITGDTEVTGAVEILGDVAITGATEVVGDFSGVGAMEVAGDVAIVGAMEVAGDIALAGAMEVAGAIVSPAYTPGAGNIL